MPIHDWNPEYGWLFHDFRAGWLSDIGRELNRGSLPPDYYALRERWTGNGFELDTKHEPSEASTGADKPPLPFAVNKTMPSSRFAILRYRVMTEAK